MASCPNAHTFQTLLILENNLQSSCLLNIDCMLEVVNPYDAKLLWRNVNEYWFLDSKVSKAVLIFFQISCG